MDDGDEDGDGGGGEWPHMHVGAAPERPSGHLNPRYQS